MIFYSSTKKTLYIIAFIIFASFNFNIFSQQINTPNKLATPYRGTRTYENNNLFYVIEIESDIEKNYYEIDIKFNLPVDPRTITLQSIFINDVPLGNKGRISFNKAATKIEIVLQSSFFSNMSYEEKNNFTIKLSGVKSFNNVSLYSELFPDIYCDGEYKFLFIKKQQENYESNDFVGEYIRIEDD